MMLTFILIVMLMGIVAIAALAVTIEVKEHRFKRRYWASECRRMRGEEE